MKKINKILISIFAVFLGLKNVVFADVVMPGETGPSGGHGLRYVHNEPSLLAKIIIGILILVIIISVIFILKRIIRNKKEKNNEEQK